MRGYPSLLQVGSEFLFFDTSEMADPSGSRRPENKVVGSIISRIIRVSRSWWSASETTVKVNDTVRSFRIQRLEILQHTGSFAIYFLI
jgi:hypothetical protein